jgi:uncharacterized lipoprotein YajG
MKDQPTSITVKIIVCATSVSFIKSFNAADKLKGVLREKIRQEIEDMCDDDDDELPESLKVARE